MLKKVLILKIDDDSIAETIIPSDKKEGNEQRCHEGEER